MKASILILISLTCVAALAAEPTVDPDDIAPLRPGFSKGHVFLSATGGSVGSPAGTLVETERQRDDKVRMELANGTLQMRFLNATVPQNLPASSPTTFQARNFALSDLEYALNSYLGVGLSYSSLSIRFTQQDVIPGYSVVSVGGQPTARRTDAVSFLPIQSNLYDGRTLQLLLTFHPLPESGFDPYVALRGGASKFSTQAHKDTDDPLRYFTHPQGTGTAVGLGLGFNIHFTHTYGIRVECGGQHQVLKSDVFQRRTLSVGYVSAGLIVNLTRFSDSEI